MNKLREKSSALSVGEKIIVIAGALLFIDGVLPWYSVDLGTIQPHAERLAIGPGRPGRC